MFTPRFWTLVSIVLAVALTRVVPHPWNFTPVGALCLFGGAYFAQRWAAFAVPLAALLLSDLILAATVYGFGSLAYVAPAYVAFALIVGLGMLLRRMPRVFSAPGAAAIVSAAVAAALLHFVVTNFAVWMSQDIYPRSGAGLIACFTAALPFLQQMLYANLVFSAILFGGFAWAQRQFPSLRPSATVTT